MAGEELFTGEAGRTGGYLKVDLKDGATLPAALGVKEPENRASFHSEVRNSEWGRHAQRGACPGLHLCCVSPTQDTGTLGFTYPSDQPIFLSEAFANSLGTISYSRLVKDL